MRTPSVMFYWFQGAGCSLLGLIQQFERWLLQFDVFWQVMEEVDGECWVLEPERPTRACTSRRVVIGTSAVCKC